MNTQGTRFWSESLEIMNAFERWKKFIFPGNASQLSEHFLAPPMLFITEIFDWTSKESRAPESLPDRSPHCQWVFQRNVPQIHDFRSKEPLRSSMKWYFWWNRAIVFMTGYKWMRTSQITEFDILISQPQSFSSPWASIKTWAENQEK